MIKFEKTEVMGWEHAIRGMRNPMNSWDKSDSGYYERIGEVIHPKPPENSALIIELNDRDLYIIGPNDYDLMKRLRNAGTDHRKFMRMIAVYVDITAPLYWWKEFDTYKVGTVANSCSTMHKIAEKEFTLEDFSFEHLSDGGLCVLKDTIEYLNDIRHWYQVWDSMKEKDRENFDPDIREKKDLWWQMIQLLSSSYNQKRTVMLNYEVLANIYKSRNNHKQDEWRIDFMKWIKSLPCSELITGEFKEELVEYKYDVNIGGAGTVGSVFVPASANEDDIYRAIIDDLHFVNYEKAEKEI